MSGFDSWETFAEMGTGALKIRLLALFVIAFICLNAGGAVCVAYCQSFEVAVTEHDQCPLNQLENHSGKSENDEAGHDSVSADSGELDCCPMTVSFFAAPVEKHTYSFDSAPPAAAVLSVAAVEHEVVQVRTPPIVHYRGPPPLDRRTLRIKHCIIRI